MPVGRAMAQWMAEFATQQARRMESYDTTLLPVVQEGLSHYEDGEKWATPITQAVFQMFEDLTDYPPGAEFRNRVRSVLLKTKDPDETPGNTAERVTKWLSTYLVNAAEYLVTDSGGEKTWITRHDDHVRGSHSHLDGKTIPSSEKFQVGDVKLRYPGEPVGDPENWINCRCVLKTRKDKAMTAAGPGPHTDGENVVPTVDPADLPAENPGDTPIDFEAEVPFHGVATVTDRPTGDRRQLARDGYSARPLPLPTFYQRAQAEGHMGATNVGRFTRIEINDAGEVEYDGFFNHTPEAAEAIQGVAEGWLRGVSVDLDDVLVDYSIEQPQLADDATDAEIMDAMQKQVTVFKQWRVAGLTIVGIPAFHEGYIKLGPRAVAGDSAQGDQALAASVAHDGSTQGWDIATETFAPGTHDGPGWITNPVPTGRIRRYWTHGEGAAKIKWGVPGDFNRCRTQIAKYIANPDWLAGTCANMHKEAIGVWPGQEDASHAIRNGLLASGAKMAEAFNLVASAAPVDLPSADLFAYPQLSGPTPITIVGDRVYGHIATWGTCHIGFGGTCTEAPRSETNYSWFRLGAVETTEGIVPVGQITLGTGHANLREGATAAAAHYDNTGTAVADIVTGEDGFGIWFSGRLRPGVTDEQRAELLAAKLSGDWREIRGNLELVAALAVNTPGFGIPRLGLAASGERQTALVAAGIVLEAPDTSTGPVQTVVDPGFLARLEQLERAARVAQFRAIDVSRLRTLADARRAARVAAIVERFAKVL